jgi:hypothetical protein
MKLSADVLKKMVNSIAMTRPDEIACDECFEQLDIFAEQMLTGKPAAEAMPLVEDHLNRCKDCHEEFEALLEAVKSLN